MNPSDERSVSEPAAPNQVRDAMVMTIAKLVWRQERLAERQRHVNDEQKRYSDLAWGLRRELEDMADERGSIGAAIATIQAAIRDL